MLPTPVIHKLAGRTTAIPLTLALLVIVAAACGTTVVTPQPVSLTLAASSSAQPLAELLADAYMQQNPHINVAIEPVSSELAAQRYVEQGRGDAALLVATPPLAFSESLTGAQVAADALVIVVNQENPMENIGLEQARAVFTGRTRLWSELEAGFGPIQVLTREAGGGVRGALQETIMGRRRLTPTALVFPGNRELREALAADPDAIGFLPASWLDPRVKALTLEGMSHEWVALNVPGYPAVLPIYLVAPVDLSPDVAALREFILSEAAAQSMQGQYGAPPKETP